MGSAGGHLGTSGIIPVTMPLPLFLSWLSSACRRVGRPFTVTEAVPNLRNALDSSPTVATVAVDRSRGDVIAMRTLGAG